MSNFHNENIFFSYYYPNFIVNKHYFPQNIEIYLSKKSLCSIIRKFSYPNNLLSLILDNKNSVLKENKFLY